jgi:hypothetical protein
MLPIGAGLRVLTPVPPRHTLRLPPDPDRTGVEVDVLPPKSERLTLPQSQRQTDDPPRAVVAGLGGLE